MFGTGLKSDITIQADTKLLARAEAFADTAGKTSCVLSDLPKTGLFRKALWVRFSCQALVSSAFSVSPGSPRYSH